MRLPRSPPPVADVVAFDATARTRPGGWTVAAAVAAIGHRGLIAMADCATADELRSAAAAGAAIVATTLCGYTADSRGAVLPAIGLLAAATSGGAFAILEGGIGSPDDVRRAFAAGAGAVVVGTRDQRRRRAGAPLRAGRHPGPTRNRPTMKFFRITAVGAAPARGRPGRLGQLGADQRRRDDLPRLAAVPRLAGAGADRRRRARVDPPGHRADRRLRYHSGVRGRLAHAP